MAGVKIMSPDTTLLDHRSEQVRKHPAYEEIRKIVDDWQHGQIRGVEVDATTASLLWQIVTNVKEENALKFLNFPTPKMVSIAWALVADRKRMDSEGGARA
jgi:hypothetical protein